MKYLLLILSFSLSIYSYAEDNSEAVAKKALTDFVLTVANNSGGINLVSNWNNLHDELSAISPDEVVNKILDSEDSGVFNESLQRVTQITLSAQTLVMLSSGPTILATKVTDQGNIYKMVAYESENAAEYDVACQEVEVSTWFGMSSELQTTCMVVNIEI